jgi:hypothetical protein
MDLKPIPDVPGVETWDDDLFAPPLLAQVVIGVIVIALAWSGLLSPRTQRAPDFCRYAETEASQPTSQSPGRQSQAGIYCS